MTIAWQQDGNRVLVQSTSGAWEYPTLSAYERKVLNDKVLPWTDLAAVEADRTGVPLSWILAMVWRESQGNPNVKTADGGYGLLGLTHSSVFQGHAKQETIDNPALNLKLGTDVIAAIIKRAGFLFPKVSSIYNAGGNAEPHPSSASPWGYRESPGHITSEVKAVNTLEELGVHSEGMPATPSGSGAGIWPWLAFTLALGIASYFAAPVVIPAVQRRLSKAQST